MAAHNYPAAFLRYYSCAGLFDPWETAGLSGTSNKWERAEEQREKEKTACTTAGDEWEKMNRGIPPSFHAKELLWLRLNSL